RSRAAPGAAEASAVASRRVLGADAGIEDAVEQIDEQVDAHERERQDEDPGLDDGIVAHEDRLHGEPADARPGEDRLGHDGASQPSSTDTTRMSMIPIQK